MYLSELGELSNITDANAQLGLSSRLNSESEELLSLSLQIDLQVYLSYKFAFISDIVLSRY